MWHQLQPFAPIAWEDDGLTYVDQRFLPDDCRYGRAVNVRSVIDAVQTSAVAGARCIDVFCAFGVVLARRRATNRADIAASLTQLRAAAVLHGAACAALDLVDASAEGAELSQALAILEVSRDIDRSIAEHAVQVLPTRGSVMTLGSSGALSTGGRGTAVGAIIAAQASGRRLHAYVSETRPNLTGMRIAAYELRAADVTCTVFPDGAAAALMQTASIVTVIVGAAEIAANGDTIGEISTFGVALAAAHHRIPFYVAAARTSIAQSARRFDAVDVARGRAPTESGPTYDSMHFDVTPGHLIAGIITEYGISRPPYIESLPNLATRPQFGLVRRRP